MSKHKAPHHRGNHDARARIIVARANANPATTCQSPHCKGWGNRTLAEHPNTRTGRPPRWQAGHVIAGQIAGALQPEADVCNTSAGAVDGNRRRAGLTPVRQW